MECADILQFLKSNSFQEAGFLEEREGGLAYTCSSGSKAPSVYVVLQMNNDEVEKVRYVGMASKGWQARYLQHNGGLRRVRDGKASNHRANFDERVDLLKSKRKFLVFERPSNFQTIFGRKVPPHYAEESALIEVLRPVDNRLKIRSDGTAEDGLLPSDEVMQLAS